MTFHIKHIIYRPQQVLMVLIYFLILPPVAYPANLLTIELHFLQQLLTLRQLVYLLQALVQHLQLPDYHHYRLIMHRVNLHHLPLLVHLVFPHLLLLGPHHEHQRHQPPLFGLLQLLLLDLPIHHWVHHLPLIWQ